MEVKMVVFLVIRYIFIFVKVVRIYGGKEERMLFKNMIEIFKVCKDFYGYYCQGKVGRFFEVGEIQ